MAQEFRIGHGFDAHRFRRGRKLVLGGVTIPHPKGLVGHSDADVLLHALTFRKNRDEGERAGVQGTPTLFVGVRNDADQSLNVLDVIRGALAYPQVKEIVERALQAQVGK